MASGNRTEQTFPRLVALGEHDHRTPSVDVLAAQGAGGWSCSPSASFWRGLAIGIALTLVFFWLPLGYVLWQVLA